MIRNDKNIFMSRQIFYGHKRHNIRIGPGHSAQFVLFYIFLRLKAVYMTAGKKRAAKSETPNSLKAVSSSQ